MSNMHKAQATKNHAKAAQRPPGSSAKLQNGNGETPAGSGTQADQNSDPLTKLEEPAHLMRTLHKSPSRRSPYNCRGSRSSKRHAHRAKDAGLLSPAGKVSDVEGCDTAEETDDDGAWVLTCIDDDTDHASSAAIINEGISQLQRPIYRFSCPGMNARPHPSTLLGQHAIHAASNTISYLRTAGSPLRALRNVGFDGSSCNSNNSSFTAGAGNSRHAFAAARHAVQQRSATGMIGSAPVAGEGAGEGASCPVTVSVMAAFGAGETTSSSSASAAVLVTPQSQDVTPMPPTSKPVANHGNGDTKGSGGGVFNRAVNFLGRQTSRSRNSQPAKTAAQEEEDLVIARAERMLKNLRCSSFHGKSPHIAHLNYSTTQHEAKQRQHQQEELSMLLAYQPRRATATALQGGGAPAKAAPGVAAALERAGPRLSSPGLVGAVRGGTAGADGAAAAGGPAAVPTGNSGGSPQGVPAAGAAAELSGTADASEVRGIAGSCGSTCSSARIPALRPALAVTLPTTPCAVSSATGLTCALSPSSPAAARPGSSGMASGSVCASAAASVTVSAAAAPGSSSGWVGSSSSSSAATSRFGPHPPADGRATSASPTPSRLSRLLLPPQQSALASSGRGQSPAWRSFDSNNNNNPAAAGATASAVAPHRSGSGIALIGSGRPTGQHAARATSMNSSSHSHSHGSGGSGGAGVREGARTVSGVATIDLHDMERARPSTSSFTSLCAPDLNTGGSGLLPKAASGSIVTDSGLRVSMSSIGARSGGSSRGPSCTSVDEGALKLPQVAGAPGGQGRLLEWH
ncbi:hypothetical protein Agub_g11149 [Astrephomene gubernaculifera]|uniref:Uncharacterized protein n=1 Tax=Astrephomene gubernaculifera TaxID=47775 RepID=A0AAD3DYV3_9CHLO|nr:hypothetical protein Agub_g11149 [Astrephomene gubernaculifera]